jgi:CheY-like chemotaxis protein
LNETTLDARDTFPPVRRRKLRRDRRPALGSCALVVSDDEPFRFQAHDGLGAAGLICEEAATGREALERLESGDREYALVVVDEELADLPAADVELIAGATAPCADLVRCGIGEETADAAGAAWIGKPALASDFARLVAQLRARQPRATAVSA